MNGSTIADRFSEDQGAPPRGYEFDATTAALDLASTFEGFATPSWALDAAALDSHRHLPTREDGPP